MSNKIDDQKKGYAHQCRSNGGGEQVRGLQPDAGEGNYQAQATLSTAACARHVFADDAANHDLGAGDAPTGNHVRQRKWQAKFS